MICQQKYGFMPKQSTTDAMTALKMLNEKYMEVQKELHCFFVDVQKAYVSLPRKELWYCMRESGVAETCLRILQDTYESSVTVVR